ETGSRLTHDLKNMLQSLLALISIAQHQAPEAVRLLRRQLPVLTQRIEAVIAKLQSPELKADITLLPLVDWWKNLRARYPDVALIWAYDGAAKSDAAQNHDASTMLIPEAVFDCVADNLINNAFNKRRREPEIVISISLREEPFLFSVCDNGSSLPEPLAHQVLRMVVVSEDGFGVGLYQAARWAEQAGYNLVMRDNMTGKVCFELSHSVQHNGQG
ncbi:MAG: sensor histidine kinase, partial [Candidatus Nitrotoga sp.]